jgi:hypothetical protein
MKRFMSITSAILLLVFLMVLNLNSIFSEEAKNTLTLKSNQDSFADLSRNKHESEKLYDEISKNLIASKKPQERDYELILKKSHELVQNHPESWSAVKLLNSIAKWHSSGFIEDEQFQFFKKKMEEYNNQDNKGRTIFSSLDDRFNKIVEKGNFTSGSFSEIIKSCKNIIGNQEISQKFKCYALLLLSRIYFELGDYSKAKICIKDIDEEYKKTRLDFNDRMFILKDAFTIRAEIVCRENGIEAAAEVWRQFIDSCARNFGDVSSAYDKMFLLLDKMDLGADVTDREVIKNKKKILLEEYISSFPEKPLLQAKLDLGYLVLNKNTSLSGNVTPERAKEFAENYRNNAKKAERIFNDALPIARNTHFEQSFLMALDFVREVQKPKPQVAAAIDRTITPAITEIPSKPIKSRIVVLVINVVLISIIVFLERKRLKRLFAKLLFRNR